MIGGALSSQNCLRRRRYESDLKTKQDEQKARCYRATHRFGQRGGGARGDDSAAHEVRCAGQRPRSKPPPPAGRRLPAAIVNIAPPACPALPACLPACPQACCLSYPSASRSSSLWAGAGAGAGD
eukprot:COSAG01_NODE_6801_length_3493_cov_4.260165_3_plen_125_part_00